MEWRGARRGDRLAAVLHYCTSLPQRGGGVAVGGTGNSVEGGGPTTTGVSSELTETVTVTVGGPLHIK